MCVRTILLLLLCQACDGDCWQVQWETGRIEVTAFDLLDERLDSVQAELFDSKLHRISTAKAGHFEGIPYGNYTIRVCVPGFYPVEVQVRLNQPELAVRAQLTLGMECRTFSSLLGTVVGARRGSTLWVKVIPVRGSGGLEAPVSPSGWFVASGLDSGRYLIVVMDGATPVHSEAVMVRGETRAKFALTGAF